MNEMSLAAGLERRKEDYGLITGQARFVDDLRPPKGRPQALYMAVVRSMYAHAGIEHIGLAVALALPGVVAAFTGLELVNDMRTLDYVPLPGLKNTERRPLAVGKVRYVGDPVAVVLAGNRYVAMDALEQVEVDYTPLQAVIDPETALAHDAQLLYEEFGSNIAFTTQLNGGDVEAAFKHAERIIRLRVVNQRLAPNSIEPRVCMFDFDPSSGILSAWMSSQAIFRVRDILAAFLNLDVDHIRIHNAEVGGAFGAKNALLGEEIIAAKLAIRFGRPIKWVEGRSENLQAQTQGRGWVSNIEAAVKNDGLLLGLRVQSIADLGTFNFGVSAMITQRMPSFLNGPYRVQAVESEVVGVFTNKVPTAPYRGAGRPEAAYILERTMDRIARELNIDPAEVRRRNFIPKEAFPYSTVTGIKYDSGNYRDALEKALELVDYTRCRAKQREQREFHGKKLLGIGISSFIELTGDSFRLPGALRESAAVRIRQDGTVLIQSGVAHSGQGHFTAFAQIVAKVFDMPGSQVEVCMNDVDLPVFSSGTFGSRVTQIAGSAVLFAAEAVRDKALQVAARVLEVDAADLVVTPSPLNPLGAKGVGEAGCIGAPPAIVNAVLDALAPLGVDAIDMPLKPEKVWTVIQDAREG
jgi:aerobic carbon-monoxide dehydrogenase large subunit